MWSFEYQVKSEVADEVAEEPEEEEGVEQRMGKKRKGKFAHGFEIPKLCSKMSEEIPTMKKSIPNRSKQSNKGENELPRKRETTSTV